MNLQEILDALNCGDRLSLFSELTSRKDIIKKDTRFPETYRQIKEYADLVAKEENYELNYMEFTSYMRNGTRDGYMSKFKRKRKYLCALGFMNLFDDDEKYLNLLENLMWSYCNEYSWASPAHLGNLLKPKYDPRKHVDLTASELGMALAEISFLLKDKLSPFLKQRIAQEVDSRLFQPVMKVHTPFNWEAGASNWTAVCAGCTGIAAVYLIEDNVELASILEVLLKSFVKYPKSFYADGTSGEGVGYWSYGFSNFTAFAIILAQRTNGAIDLMKTDNMKNIACFMSNSLLSENYVVNFGDCDKAYFYPEGFIHKLKEFFPEVEVPDVKYVVTFESDSLGRWNRFIRDIAWRREEYRTNNNKSCCTRVFEDAQWMCARKKNGLSTFYIAAKGGNNAESHNHNDIGTVLYYIDDNPFLVDMGAGKYDSNYFTERRYESIYANSFGHSVPIVNGDGQCAGKNYAATCFETEITNEKVSVIIGLEGAYENVQSLKRYLEIYEDGTLELIDRFENCVIGERFVAVSTSKPEITKGKITLFGENCNAEILYVSENVNKVNIIEAGGFFYKECQKMYFIDFTPADRGEFRISVRKSDK